VTRILKMAVNTPFLTMRRRWSLIQFQR